MKVFIIILIFVVITAANTQLMAQYSTGTTGMLNIPTADCGEAGSVKLGANIIPLSMIPNMSGSYNYTYNYFATVSFFSFLEVSYRTTLFKSTYMTEEAKFNQQDRTYSAKILVMKERDYLPGFALGANDPFALGYNYYASYYGVLSKGVTLRGGDHISASLGYNYMLEYLDGRERRWSDGVFGGVSYTPSFYKDMTVMAEYDSNVVNIGASVLLWRHLSLHCFACNFNAVSAGVRYECVLLH